MIDYASTDVGSEKGVLKVAKVSLIILLLRLDVVHPVDLDCLVVNRTQFNVRVEQGQFHSFGCCPINDIYLSATVSECTKGLLSFFPFAFST